MRDTLIPVRCKRLLSSRFDLTIQPAPATLENKPNREFASDSDMQRSEITPAFSCGARSAFNPRSKKLLEKHAIAPSAARLC